MPRVQSSVQINAPPEAAWALMCDVRRYPEWVVPTDRIIELPVGTLGRGSVYREYGGIPPFKSESEWRVMEFEPQRRQVHMGDDGSMRIKLTIEITPSGEGSQVMQRVELTPRWWLRLPSLVMWPLLMRSRTRRAMDETAANAKRVLEAGTG